MGAPISALAVYLSGVDWFEVLVIGAIVHRMKAKPRGMQDIGARLESGGSLAIPLEFVGGILVVICRISIAQITFNMSQCTLLIACRNR